MIAIVWTHHAWKSPVFQQTGQQEGGHALSGTGDSNEGHHKGEWTRRNLHFFTFRHGTIIWLLQLLFNFLDNALGHIGFPGPHKFGNGVLRWLRCRRFRLIHRFVGPRLEGSYRNKRIGAAQHLKRVSPRPLRTGHDIHGPIGAGPFLAMVMIVMIILRRCGCQIEIIVHVAVFQHGQGHHLGRGFLRCFLEGLGVGLHNHVGVFFGFQNDFGIAAIDRFATLGNLLRGVPRNAQVANL
mmetsp:Transcript_13961/g.30534  ORF Transcript_13961/g.30534 Transcript_13961/m.30534 type:complete len:239 (-) Transcript_13961:1381-2097(-)